MRAFICITAESVEVGLSYSVKITAAQGRSEGGYWGGG